MLNHRPFPPNPTPEGQLGRYLKGDLAPARRHLERVRSGQLPIGLVLDEIAASIERCVQRIDRDIRDDPETPQT